MGAQGAGWGVPAVDPGCPQGVAWDGQVLAAWRCWGWCWGCRVLRGYGTRARAQCAHQRACTHTSAHQRVQVHTHPPLGSCTCMHTHGHAWYMLAHTSGRGWRTMLPCPGAEGTPEVTAGVRTLPWGDVPVAGGPTGSPWGRAPAPVPHGCVPRGARGDGDADVGPAGGRVDNCECGWPRAGRVRQHVRAQQLQARAASAAPRPLRR